MTARLVFTALSGIPCIRPGDDLAEVIWQALEREQIRLALDDVIVVTQKVVSKAEGRHVNLSLLTPSPRALELAADQAAEEYAKLD